MARKYIGVIVGDSQSAIATATTRPRGLWPFFLAQLLRAQGCDIDFGAWGRGGSSTAEILNFTGASFRHGTPDVAGVFGGYNDPTNGSRPLVSVARTVPGNGSTAEVQTITLGSFVLGGAYKLTNSADLTPDVDWQSTGTQIATALNALTSISSVGGVTGAGPAGGPWTMTFNQVGARTALGINAATMTQLHVQAIIKVFKHGAHGDSHLPLSGSRGRIPLGPVAVATQASLPAGHRPGSRVVVMKDTASTSGAAPDTTIGTAAAQGLASNVGTAGGDAQTVWECRDARPGASGWGRVVNAANAAPTACKRIFVAAAGYTNNTSGDTPATSDEAGNNGWVRAAFKAAVAAEAVTVDGVPAVIYTDVFGYMKNLIATGAMADLSTVYDQTVSPQAGASDIHYNEFGHQLIAKSVLSGGTAGTAFPAAWKTALV